MAGELLSKTALIITADAKAFQSGLNAASAQANSFAGKLQGTFTNLSGMLTGLFTNPMIMGALAVGVLVQQLKSAADAIDDMAKISRRLGITFEELSSLSYAAGMAGIDSSQLSAGLDKLNKGIAEATGGSRQMQEAFAAVGVDLDTLKSSDVNEIMMTMADSFSEMEGDAEKTKAAVDLFGKSGAPMVELLSGGSESLKEMREEAEALGLVLSNAQAEGVEAALDSISKISEGIKGFFMQIAASIAPVVKWIAETFATVRKVISPILDIVLTLLSPIVALIGAVFAAVSWFFDKVAKGLALIAKGFKFVKDAALSLVPSFVKDALGKKDEKKKVQFDAFGSFKDDIKNQLVAARQELEKVDIDSKFHDMFGSVATFATLDRIKKDLEEIKRIKATITAIQFGEQKIDEAVELQAHLKLIKKGPIPTADEIKVETLRIKSVEDKDLNKAVAHAEMNSFLKDRIKMLEQVATLDKETLRLQRAITKEEQDLNDLKIKFKFTAMKDEFPLLELSIFKNAQAKLGEEVRNTTLDLERQIATAGMTENEIKKWDAMRKTINGSPLLKTGDMKADILSDLDKNIASERLAKATTDLVAFNNEVMKQGKAFGLTREEALLYQAALEGVDFALLNAGAEALRFKGAMDKASRIKEEFQSPVEKMQGEIEKIQDAFDLGLLSIEQFGFGVDRAMQEAAKALGMGQFKAAEVQVSGSQAATDTILRSQNTTTAASADERMSRILTEGNALQKVSNDRLLRIAEQMLSGKVF